MSLTVHNDLSLVSENMVYLGMSMTNANNFRLFLGNVYTMLQNGKAPSFNSVGDVQIMFTDLFNSPTRSRFFDLPNNISSPNVDSFLGSSGVKVVVDMAFTYFDPQIFHRDLKAQALYKGDTVAFILDKANKDFPSLDNFQKDLGFYLKRFEEPVGKFKKILDNMYSIYAKWGVDHIIIPVLCYDTYFESGLLDDPRFSFIRYEHLVSSCISKRELLAERDTDVFFSGSALSIVYPYRFVFRETKAVSFANNFSFYDDYPSYIGDYIYPRNELLSKKDEIYDVSELQTLNDTIEKLDNERYGAYLDHLQNSRISVCCSSIFGFPLKKFVESMSKGCVVVGDLPKYPELCGIRDGFNAVQCTLDEIEDTVEKLLRNPTKTLYLASNALDLIEDRYTGEAYARRFFEELGKLLSVRV